MKKFGIIKINIEGKLLRLVFVGGFVAFFGVNQLAAQSAEKYKEMIRHIDQNSLDLAFYKQELEAVKIENRTGLNPDNPRLEVGYLRPNPRLKNQVLNFEITQDFEFPTVYGQKRRLADEKNQLAQLDFRQNRAELIENVLEIWSEWVYQQKLVSFLKTQENYASLLYNSSQKSFQSGAISILERNKAQIFAINAKKELELAEIQAADAYKRLLVINQGQKLDFLDAEIYPVPFLENSQINGTETLIANSLAIQTMDQLLSTNRQDVALKRAQNLPELSLGFVREQDIEVDFKGVTLGLSIPLWQNKNQVKAAKTKQLALEKKKESLENNISTGFDQLVKRQAALISYYEGISKSLENNRNLELIHKAFELGEITVSDYLIEQNLMVDLQQKLLQAEYDLSSIWIKLRLGNW